MKIFHAALRGEMTDDGFIGIEGPYLVEEALRSGLRIQAILASTSAEAWLEHNLPGAARLDHEVRLLRTTDRLFAAVSDTKSPQGLAALVEPRAHTFDDLFSGTPLVVVLVGVQDPGNVGTILRSAEAFAATGALLCRGTASPWMPKVLRASAGSALRLPLLPGPAAPIALAQLRAVGVKSYAASLQGESSPAETNLREPCALLVGNEAAGLPADLAQSADARIRIPLAAGVNSLNAAVAASVLLYEAARQRAR